MRYLSLFIIILLLASCSTERKCNKAQRKYELASYKYGCAMPENSITTNTIVRDTTIYVPIPGEVIHDSIRVPYIAQFTTAKNVLETKYALSTAWIENSLLKHTLIQKQSNIPATLPGVIQASTTIQEKIIKVPYPVEKIVKAPLRWIEKALIWSGSIAWLLGILFALYRFRKLIIPGLPF